MSLPGKLCIGIIEEDNPQKAYFRFKPLLVEAEGRYIPYSESPAYPEEGCIRIVPDKNEAYHFKSRMRRMGLFCAVDLRNHPEDNDKIRPNKNYREGSQEHNAFIIYSDVVREIAPEAVLEILAEAEAPRPRPHTSSVLLRGEALSPERYGWEAAGEDGEGGIRLIATDERLELETLQCFELEGFSGQILAFAIAPPDALSRPSAPAMEKAAPDKQPAPAEAKADAAPIAPENAAEASDKAPGAPSGPGAKPSRPQGQAPRDGDKPWIHRDNSMLPRPVDPRLSPAQRNLAIQSGMNPRRGRSLQELIDEKWQHSRLNQLGQPVQPIHTGAPVASPVECAVDAVRDVWNQPQLRQELLASLSGIEEFGASLDECREAARQRDIEQHLEGLEARRLALLSELDHLTLRHAETRQALKAELRRDEDAALAEAVQRTEAARAEQARCEALALEAREAAQDARKAVDALTGEALEERLRDFALNQRMLERIRLIRGEADALPPAPPSVQSIDLNALAVRAMNRFDAYGYAITRLEALNLCACAAVSPALILSGPVGSGKTETARILAEAFGWTDIDRYLPIAPGKSPLEADPRIRALDALPQTPAMLLLDDANLYPTPDPLRGLSVGLRDAWRLVLTLQDGGCPVPPNALDRGFTVRLNPKKDSPWRPRPSVALAPERPVSLSLTVPDAPLPAALESRMGALRGALGKHGAVLSRRALDDAWRYCALMLSALGESGDPLRVLDLAVAQRLLPALIASAPIEALGRLDAALDGLPVSRALLRQPLPVTL